jgi:hypothetical protein
MKSLYRCVAGLDVHRLLWCASHIPAFLYCKKPLFGLIWP